MRRIDTKRLKKAAIIFFPIAIIFSSLDFYLLFKDRASVLHKIKTEEAARTLVGSHQLTEMLDNIYSDLLLATYHESIDLKHLREEWVPLVKVKPWYDQIRFIDEMGEERLCINSLPNGPFVVPKKDHQNKKGYYYFDDCLKLSRGQIFISPLDLNIERGQVEVPYKPILRIGTPILDSKDKKLGIVIINYTAQILFDKFQTAGLGEIELLNSEGYWLKSGDSTREWGFMFQRTNQTFANKEPQIWKVITESANGHVVTQNEIWTFRKVWPTQTSEPWILLTSVPVSEFQTLIFQRGTFASVLVLIFLLIGLVSYFIAGVQLKEISLKQMLLQNVNNLEKELMIKKLQIQTAQKVQQQLNEVNLPDSVSFRFETLYLPSEELGGDFMIIKQVEDQIVIILGDCEGHGIGAALDSVLAKSVCDNLQPLLLEGQLIEFMGRVNKTMGEYLHGERFLTLFVAVVSTRTKTMRYVNANGELPCIKGRDGARFLDPPAGMHIGYDSATIFSEKNLSLTPGDILLFYSDALREIRVGDEWLGRSFISEKVNLFENSRGNDLDLLLSEIRKKTTLPLKDDLTLVRMKCL